MSGIAAIGERELVGAFAFAGVDVTVADGAAAGAAWRALPEEVALVILSPAAHAALEAEGLDRRDRRLWVVMPA